MTWWPATALAATGVADIAVDDAGERLVGLRVDPGRSRPALQGPAVVEGTALSFGWPDPRARNGIGVGGATTRSGIARVRFPWPEGARAVTLGGLRREPVLATGTGAARLHGDGAASERLDLVILPDGYTADELPRFATDADAVVAHLLTLEPWNTYRDLLGVWRVDLESAESGVDHPEWPEPFLRDTALGCTYACEGVQRLVCCDDVLVLAAADAAVPFGDGILVLVNDADYGGAGGFTYAAAFTGDEEAVRVAAHEIGHTLVGLWDEYDYGISGVGDGPNCAEADALPWEEWVGIEGVDAFPTCSYDHLVRPTDDDCIMRTLRDDYCPVCRQEAIFALYDKVPALVVASDPEVGATAPVGRPIVLDTVGDDERLTFRWLSDDVEVGTGRSFTPTCDLPSDVLGVEVRDPTPWVRDDPYALTWEVAGPWTVDRKTCPGSCGCHHARGAWLGLVFPLWWRRRR